jgi:hypothetical protein
MAAHATDVFDIRIPLKKLPAGPGAKEGNSAPVTRRRLGKWNNYFYNKPGKNMPG